MATTPRSIYPIPIVKELGENERDRSDSCSFLPSELDEREIRLPSVHLSLSLTGITSAGRGSSLVQN